MPAIGSAPPRTPRSNVAPSLAEGDPRPVPRASGTTAASDQGSRRRVGDPTSCESDSAAAELEFQQAMEAYKQRSGRLFPTWSEVLEVLQGLGYAKAAAARR